MVSHEHELVGEDQLLHVPCKDGCAAALPFLRRRRAPVEIILEKFPCSYDRTGHQLWEKSNEKGIIDVAFDGWLLAAINVNNVRDALKGVEADPQREDDIEWSYQSAGMCDM